MRNGKCHDFHWECVHGLEKAPETEVHKALKGAGKRGDGVDGHSVPGHQGDPSEQELARGGRLSHGS